MAGNAGKGRIAGSKNKRTEALLEQLESGETPCAFGLRIMRDENQTADLRLQAAKLVAPYVHSKPHPEPRIVTFALPECFDGAADLLQVNGNLLRATASGELSIEDAKEISTILDTHRRLVETVDLDARISRLEKESHR